MISLTESLTLSVSLLNKVRISRDIIYFDFTKAFGSVCHDLTLKKIINRFGRLVKFLKSYLKVCKPIIGPLLFVLFIRDIYNNRKVNDNSSIELYANDAKKGRKLTFILIEIGNIVKRRKQLG